MSITIILYISVFLETAVTRTYVGENATLLWHIPNIDMRSPFICKNDLDAEIVHLINLTGTDEHTGGDFQMKTELIIDREAKIFGFTLLNISMHDAGEYVCWQAHGEARSGTVLVWGR